MKKCAASLIIRDMQIKGTMRHYLTSIRKGTIQKETVESNALVKMWKNWTFCALLGGCKMVHPLWKTVYWVLRKLKIG